MERSSFFNAIVTGVDENGFPIYDRSYKAEQFAEFFSSFIGNGVFPNPATNCQVVSIDNNMQIRIKVGKAFINGYIYTNDSDCIHSIEVADSLLNRIDRVVLRLDFINREIKSYVKKGIFASSPVAPELQRDADMYEICIAEIKVKNGVIKISQTDITDTRLDKNLCGVVHGTVDQVDTSEIFRQYQAWFGEKSVEFETEFKVFLDSLKDLLSGDVAGNLLNKIVTLEDKVGDTTILNTTDKTRIVNAINEVNNEVKSQKADYVNRVAYAVATGTANTYAVTLSPAPTSLVEGMAISVKINIANTGASTININGLGVKAIKKSNGNDVSSGNLKLGGIYTLRYDGLNFILQGEGGEYGTATASEVLSGYTIGTENGLVNGTYSNIKSIQRGTVSFGATSILENITISPIDINKSILIVRCPFAYATGELTNDAYGRIRGKISNSNTISLERYQAGGVSAVAFWEVVEFQNVKSVQRGDLTLIGTTNYNVGINTVNINKSLVICSFKVTSNTNVPRDTYLTFRLSSSTNLEFKRYAWNIGYIDVYWQVIEFN